MITRTKEKEPAIACPPTNTPKGKSRPIRAATAALIVNPRSGKASGKGLALAERIANACTAETAIIEDFAALPAMLAGFAGSGVDTLFISSGDGTIQAILTELAEHRPFPRLPRLVLLPHGTTNMSAADLGLRITSLDEQARLITDREALAAATQKRLRPTVRVANARDGQIRHGMFVGAGVPCQGTRFCQEAVHRTGLMGDWASFATLLAGLARAVVLPPDPDNPDRLDRPHAMRVRADGEPVSEGEQLAFLATTLNRLVLGARPFWGGTGAPIRASLFPYPPPNPLRWLLPALYGGEDRRAPPGAISFTAHDIDIATAAEFVIDGEFFDPPEKGPLRLETGPEITFLCRR